MSSVGGKIGAAIILLVLYIVLYPGLLLSIPAAPGTGLMGIFPSKSVGALKDNFKASGVRVAMSGAILTAILVLVGPLIVDTRL